MYHCIIGGFDEHLTLLVIWYKVSGYPNVRVCRDKGNLFRCTKNVAMFTVKLKDT